MFGSALKVRRFDNLRQPRREKLGAAASRIHDGVPAQQPELPHARRKDDGGAADRFSMYICGAQYSDVIR